MKRTNRRQAEYLERHGLEDTRMQTYLWIEWNCRGCKQRKGKDHRVGTVLRDLNLGEEHWGNGISAYTNDAGQVVLTADCRTCRNVGRPCVSEVAWTKMRAMLDTMASTGQHRRSYTPGRSEDVVEHGADSPRIVRETPGLRRSAP